MQINPDVFLTTEQSNGLLPDLGHDLLLADGKYPIIFTCVGEDRLFLAVCRYRNGGIEDGRAEYLLVESTYTDILQFLKSELSLHGLFTLKTIAYEIVFSAKEEPKVIPFSPIDDELGVMPAPGRYLNAQKEDLRWEINALEERIEAQNNP